MLLNESKKPVFKKYNAEILGKFYNEFHYVANIGIRNIRFTHGLLKHIK
jgi:hypothetical protein